MVAMIYPGKMNKSERNTTAKVVVGRLKKKRKITQKKKKIAKLLSTGGVRVLIRGRSVLWYGKQPKRYRMRAIVSGV